ncbi:MAG: hypothetical protein NT062_21105 [Proteobacteria bacterium]|nr:hypothetical protein [Pseudomonadota bacterium]
MRTATRTISLALCVSLAGCTLFAGAAGGVYAQSQNSDPRVERGEKPPTSVLKSMGVGACIGLVIDAAFVALAFATGGTFKL